MYISFYCLVRDGLTGQTTNKKPKPTYAHKYELQKRKKQFHLLLVFFFSKSYKNQEENSRKPQFSKYI